MAPYRGVDEPSSSLVRAERPGLHIKAIGLRLWLVASWSVEDQGPRSAEAGQRRETKSQTRSARCKHGFNHRSNPFLPSVEEVREGS